MNDVKSYLNPAEKKMNDAVLFLEDVLSHLRAGKANVSILFGSRNTTIQILFNRRKSS